ncbi:MAG: hypothetical protein HQP61_10180 [Peptococcaceae bacterium]|nr:hypothetical protein [Candidatus Syntrophopropionicum ammoniitolerans]
MGSVGKLESGKQKSGRQKTESRKRESRGRALTLCLPIIRAVKICWFTKAGDIEARLWGIPLG